MKSFQDGYNRVLDNIGGIEGSFEGGQYAKKVEEAVNNAIDALRNEATHRQNVGIDYLKGWLAEQWHAETLKVSAAARGPSDVWARVPGDNGPGDLFYGDSTFARWAQVKYYKTGEETSKAISHPKYEGMQKIVPKDQLEEVKRTAERLGHKPSEISCTI